jgi:hypothetical protein
MSSKKISQLPAAGILDGTEEFAINQSGLTSKVTLDEIKTYSQPTNVILSEKVTVTSAEILDAYDTQVELIPAPPAGFYIDPISIVYRFDYDSTPYATNTSGIIVLSDEGSVYDIDLTRANSDVCKTSNSGDFVTDGAMLFTVEDGNPTAGDSDLIIYITYQIIEL